MSNIFDTLVWRDGSGQLVPSLAESWEFTDPETLELHLRPGVQFHDGSAFTADDVTFTFRRYLDGEKAVALRTYLVGLVESVEKVDDHTVRLHTPEPKATILAELTRIPILPQAYFDEVGEAKFGQEPVGTGPFEFDTWQKNERLVLDAYDSHWRGSPDIDRLVFRPVPEDFSRHASLREGEVNLITNVSPDRAAALENDPDLNLASVHSVRNMFVGMNTSEPPFDDVRVRRAMNHAVDVEAIVEAILGGRAYVNPSVCSEPIFGHSPVEPYPYDPERARELLAEAGYPDGFTVTMWGTDGRYTMDREVQQAIAAQLQQVGVTVEHHMPEWAEFWGAYSSGEIEGMAMLGTGNPILDCDATMGYRIHSERGGTYYNTPEVDALIEQEIQEVDEEARLEIFAEIQEQIRDDAPWIFLYDQEDLYGTSGWVEWQPRPDELIWGFDIGVKR